MKTTQSIELAVGIAMAVAVGASWAEEPSSAPSPAAPAADVFQDETITPAPGDYKMVELSLEGSRLKSWNRTGPEFFKASFRDGIARKVKIDNYKKYAAALAVTDTSIQGAIVWRPEGADYIVTVNGTIKDGVIGGTWELTKRPAEGEKGSTFWEGPTQGALAGKITTEAELAKANALPKGKDWPQYYGPNNGSFAVPPSGLTLVTDPQAVRLQWRSEEFTAGGQGNAQQYYFAGQVEYTHAQGGGASPILSADGKLYVNYFRPAGTKLSETAIKRTLGTPDIIAPDPFKDPGGRTYWAYLNRMKKQPEPEAMLKFLDRADDIIVCMDAATGKTLWKTIYGGKGVFMHGHKLGPVNNTPCLGDGRVYAMGCGGKVYALDAATGTPLWETVPLYTRNGEDGPFMDRNTGNAPIFVDGVVVVGDQAATLYGFDAATGKELWKLPGKNSLLAVPARWVHEGKHYVLTIDGHSHTPTSRIFCVEVKTGTVVWETPYPGGLVGGVSVCGDTMVGVAGGVRNSDSTNYCVAAYHLTPTHAEPLWKNPYPMYKWTTPTIPPVLTEKMVIVGFAAEANDLATKVMLMLDAKTGKELASVEPPKDLQGWNEPVMILVEDRLVLIPDNSHGSQTLGFFGGTPETFKHLFTWNPPHPTTSSYHAKPMMLPWVDGRVFIRGLDGIYSYDFRAKE